MAISVYQLKPAFIALLRPLARLLAAWGITANHLTVTACVLSCVYGLALFLASGSAFLWFGLPVWLFLRMALNALDGILAREHNQKTRLGALLNEMGDVLSDAALFLPLMMLPGVWGIAVAAFIWLALLTEYCGVIAVLAGSPRLYDGPMGKSDRAFAIGLAGLLMGFSLHYGWNMGPGINLGLLAGCILMGLTAYNRLRSALKHPSL